LRETINKTSTVWLILPILEGDHKQDINSLVYGLPQVLVTLAILLMSCVWSPSSIGNISHTVDVLFMVSLRETINRTSTVWLMLPILEGDHKQDINSMEVTLTILLMSCLWSPSSIGNISHTVDVLCMVSLKGDYKQDINSMLMLPILEGDHKQDINSMANVTYCIGNISHTVDVLFMVSLKY
jgi:hypothetical protein